jgi:hypothetical protein
MTLFIILPSSNECKGLFNTRAFYCSECIFIVTNPYCVTGFDIIPALSYKLYHQRLYRVAAIFPEHFQGLTVALKNDIFFILSCHTVPAVCRAIEKPKRHIPAKMNQQEATRAGAVS